jgi:glycosyltransferase involved in cell wall biosynthesis
MTIISEITKISRNDSQERNLEESGLHPFHNRSQRQDTAITIIIPVHNEEKRLLHCLQRTIEYCDSIQWDYELIIVEDGSTDRTVEIAQDMVSRNDRVKLVSNEERLGKGKAIRSGVLYAEKKFVGYMDADLSADPSEFERLLPFIDDFDIVVGSRILRGQLPRIKRPFIRSFLSSCYSKLFRTVFRGITIYDPQCGLKLFKMSIAQDLLSQIETNGFAFDCEVIAKASSLGFSIKEVPIIWEHQYGSKVSILPEIMKMARDLFIVWYKTKASRNVLNQSRDKVDEVNS